MLIPSQSSQITTKCTTHISAFIAPNIFPKPKTSKTTRTNPMKKETLFLPFAAFCIIENLANLPARYAIPKTLPTIRPIKINVHIEKPSFQICRCPRACLIHVSFIISYKSFCSKKNLVIASMHHPRLCLTGIFFHVTFHKIFLCDTLDFSIVSVLKGNEQHGFLITHK